jgi:hypothetical protein
MTQHTESPSAVFRGGLQVEARRLEPVHGIGCTREDVIQAAARQLGFPPYSENLLIAAG